MTKQTERAALAAEKNRLIKEGELYRVGVVHGKALVAQALQPDALLHSAVEHAAGMAKNRLSGLLQPGGLSGINLKVLMPYALTIGSFLARKRLVKPALGVAAVLGAGLAWLLRNKSEPDETSGTE